MVSLIDSAKTVLHDRIQWMAVLIVLSFVSVLLLRSQSAASYPTYFLGLLMLAFVAHWKDVFQIELMRWVVALLVWLSLSTFWSEPFELRSAASVWIRALLVLCFVVAVAECQLRGQLQRWAGNALTVVGTVAVVVAIANFYITDPPDDRLNGMGQLSTHVIAALVYGVVLLFVLERANQETGKTRKAVLVAVASVIVFAIALSDSRNAWVAVSIGAIVLFLSWRIPDAKQFLIATACGVLLLGVAILAVLASDAGRELLLPRGLSFRPTIWSAALERVVETSVWFGIGIATPEEVIGGGMTFSHPHNMYLAVFSQGGVVALVLYLVVLWQSIAQLLESYSEPVAKLALSILALSLTAHLLDGHELVEKVGDTWFLIWFPVAVAISLKWRPAE
jgi:O-antigen ligase